MGLEDDPDPPVEVHSDLCEPQYLLCPGKTLLNTTMGSVLSTPYIENSHVITYRCPSPPHFYDYDYSPLFSPADFSPILSSVYNPDRIITILTDDSDSE